MARPKGVKAPEKEKAISMIDSIYGELQVLRERAAHFEKLVDEKNLQIAALKRSASAEFQNDLHEFLTPAMAYGRLMKIMRLEAGLTGQTMARKLYLSNSQLSKMEYGDPLVSLNTIIIAYEAMRTMKERGELNNENKTKLS